MDSNGSQPAAKGMLFFGGLIFLVYPDLSLPRKAPRYPLLPSIV